MMDIVESELIAGNPWVTRHKLTVSNYHAMGKAGILPGDARIELINGQLLEMAPIGSEHNGGVNWLNHALVRAIGDRAIVQVQGSTRLDEQTEPQPDFAVLRPRDDFYRGFHAGAGDILLLVEIADGSLKFDRVIKRPLYARAGIPEYWIVNLVDGEVEICRQPGASGYAQVQTARRGDVIEPALLSGVTISVSDLLG